MSLLMQPCDCESCTTVQLSGATPSGGRGVPDNSAIRAAFSRLMQWLYKKKDFKARDLRDPEVRRMIDETSKVFSQVVDNELKEVKPDDAIVRQLKKSGFVFSGMKTAVQMAEAASLLVNENGDFKSFEKFLKDVQKIDETYNEHYLHAEYKFAVASAQMADKWHRFAADGDRFDLQYRTAGDNRVRDSHAALHNVTLPFDSPFWDKYYPPNGWGCRCTVVQVRKGKFPRTDESVANKLGAESTAGKHAAMFRFNPGKSGNLFPPRGPYMPSNCDDCDLGSGKLSLARIPDNELCQACRIVQEMAKRDDQTWTDVETKRGKVRVSSLHGKGEKAGNIKIATYLAEKYEYEIYLIRKRNDRREADTFNKTLGYKQEYIRNITPSINAIDQAIRDAKGQADNIVLSIESDISRGDLKNAVQSRVRRSKNIVNITIIWGQDDRTYSRDQIIKPDWGLWK